jgi:hypothetical protein
VRVVRIVDRVSWARSSIRPPCVRVRRGFVCIERDERDERDARRE